MGRSSRAVVLASLLFGCAPVDAGLHGEDDAGLWTGSPYAMGGPEAPPSAVRIAVGTLVPGRMFAVTVVGAEPGERVYLLGTTGGLAAGACPAPIGGTCLGIASPFVVLGSRVADGAGGATFTVTLPPSVALGTTIGLQVAVPRGPDGVDSVVSNPEARRVVDGVVHTLDDAEPGDLVVSEVMQNPRAVADADGEWFELLNASPRVLDLDGLEVSDLGSNAFTVVGPLHVGPGERVVFGSSADRSENGDVAVDYVWSDFALGNADDEVVLRYDGALLDSVAWDGGPAFPDPDGAAMQLSSDAEDAVRNDLGASWCEPTLTYGDGDRGTPGFANEACGEVLPTCDDGLMNGDETGVDCGGSCPACDEPSYARDEDFETGDFSAFPYLFTGTHPWSIEDDPATCRSGAYCMRTHPSHAGGETSTLELSLSVREDTEIAFWADVHTEPGEHFFRFYIDGELQVEESGSLGWSRYAFPVERTGPGGALRTFTWEYSRSLFIDPSHPPYNVVVVDDIEMPDWNTRPGTPETLAPWNGAWQVDTPTFEWASSDPDGDRVTYELQYADEPTFALPYTTGETFDTAFTPDLADDVYYWRVRAKDDSDYTWSPWSDTWTVEVDSAAPQDVAWRQTEDGQLALSTFEAELAPEGDRIEGLPGGIFDEWTPWEDGWRADSHAFREGLGPVPEGTVATWTVEVRGDFDDPSETIDLYATRPDYSEDRVYAGWNPGGCGSLERIVVEDDRYQPYYDGEWYTDFRLDLSDEVSYDECGGLRGRVNLAYAIEHTVTSPPIHIGLYGDPSRWDKVQWEGVGATVRVTDGDGVLLPEDVLPGNAEGFDGRTVHLWGVDPAAYPVLRLQADLGTGDVLEDWRVYAGDAFTWTFDQDGDTEGWEAFEFDGAPALEAVDGVLRFDGTADGTDPNVQYGFPVPLAAAGFTELEVTARTSNTYHEDRPALFWESEYGGFDDRRSVVVPEVFLYEFQTFTFDLT